MWIVNSSFVLKTLPHIGQVTFVVDGVFSGGGEGGCPGIGSGGIGGGAVVSLTGSIGFLL